MSSGKKFIIPVTGAKLNKKGEVNLITRWRMYKAVKLGQSLRSAHYVCRYAIIPHPSAAGKNDLQRLVAALLARDPDYRATTLTPVPDEPIQPSAYSEFLENCAQRGGFYYVYP